MAGGTSGEAEEGVNGCQEDGIPKGERLVGERTGKIAAVEARARISGARGVRMRIFHKIKDRDL
jgi:hypothetical protein